MKTAEAKVKAILLADDPESFVTRRIPEVSLEFGGIPGDRHFGITAPSDSRQPMYPRQKSSTDARLQSYLKKNVKL
ncbi:hypothetical protein skT53_33010 [Effusibacillus dendaii]|uniref:Uncharacterized protein n=1 Tax=Effusibacillus dendaii TaxID=2743772 RepID=A0A7I8DHD2_9BACL|nr:hypothetical protein skT53_33010 [Effusibacillus dendaii]